jgi:hypothetical protein
MQIWYHCNLPPLALLIKKQFIRKPLAKHHFHRKLHHMRMFYLHLPNLHFLIYLIVDTWLAYLNFSSIVVHLNNAAVAAFQFKFV